MADPTADTFYVDPYSRQFCFSCYLPDCVGEADPACPIAQRKRLEKTGRVPSLANSCSRSVARVQPQQVDGYVTLPQIEREHGLTRSTVSAWVRRRRVDVSNWMRGKRNAWLVPESEVSSLLELAGNA